MQISLADAELSLPSPQQPYKSSTLPANNTAPHNPIHFPPSQCPGWDLEKIKMYYYLESQIIILHLCRGKVQQSLLQYPDVVTAAVGFRCFSQVGNSLLACWSHRFPYCSPFWCAAYTQKSR